MDSWGPFPLFYSSASSDLKEFFAATLIGIVVGLAIGSVVGALRKQK